MSNNKAILDKGFKKANQLIFGHLYNQCIRLCEKLIQDALVNREFMSFTGNTITSFACGIYVDGALNYMLASGENMAQPVHAKVQKDEVVYLNTPYEGFSRMVKGAVNIVYDISGMETSFRILRSLKPSTNGLSIIMTTGTEYSTYLESRYHFNVLSNTAEDWNVKQLLYSSFKPLP